VRLIKYFGNKKIINLKEPIRIDKAKKYGYKKLKNYRVYLIRIKKSINKKKSRKGKVFGKTKNHGTLKRKKNYSYKELAYQKLSSRRKKLKVLNLFKIIENKSNIFFEAYTVL